jgi:hypothetical protein
VDFIQPTIYDKRRAQTIIHPSSIHPSSINYPFIIHGLWIIFMELDYGLVIYGNYYG